MRFGIELPLLNVGNPKWPARLTGRSNDPGGRRKQIPLQYAGIGESYGCALIPTGRTKKLPWRSDF
jgi:hypothetical protein